MDTSATTAQTILAQTLSGFVCTGNGGIPEGTVKKAFQSAEIYVSPELLKEYREVPLSLEAEGKIVHIQLKALISAIATFVTKAEIVYPAKRVSIATPLTVCSCKRSSDKIFPAPPSMADEIIIASQNDVRLASVCKGIFHIGFCLPFGYQLAKKNPIPVIILSLRPEAPGKEVNRNGALP